MSKRRSREGWSTPQMSMRHTKRHCWSSRRKVSSAGKWLASHATVSSPKAIEGSSFASGSPCAIWSASSDSRSVIFSALDRAGPADLLLQLHHAIDQGFRRRRAARDIDVDRNDAVAAANHGVGIMIVAPAIGAGAHGDDIARLRHLVVDLAQRRRHLVAQRAGDDHHIRLAWRAARGKAEALEITARHRGLHHLDGAAG